MPYNHGMAHITLVLPFALPAPEFAPDLARALEAPALAALLSRTSAHSRMPSGSAARALPHEVWLARALGLESGGQPAFAVAAMRGYGLEPGTGTWFIVNPTHIEIARSHLLMADLRQLRVSEEDGRALFAAARQSFDEAGYGFEYGDADTWFARADDWNDMETSSPDTAVGMNLMDWMPAGPRAIAYRKLQNEVQMAWYTNPVNAAREARGLPPVNAFWLWSGAPASTTSPKPQNALGVAAFETPGWLTALAQREITSLVQVATDMKADTLLICGNASAPAIAADWAAWLGEMQRLETELFAPLLAALMRGDLSAITLVLSNREAHAEFTTTALAQRKFWRRPTLDRLI
ncbi:MAG: hypothetical protein ACJ8LG_00695 [Massilia sp.]